MDNKNIPYIRVATTFYKIVKTPKIYGNATETLVKWKAQTIIQDKGRPYLDKIPKYDAFCCKPDHIDYKREYENHYNIYNPLSHNSTKGSINYTLIFLEHIFGEQIELGLDYLQLLYMKPTQILPVLCLVSRDRATGKSTFLKWLKCVFESNFTYLSNHDFSSSFNSDWANKLLVCIDEVLFKTKEITERIKFLSTTDTIKIEAKGRDKVEREHYGKFILCSNNETTFVKIDREETRFWIIKVPIIDKEDSLFLEKLKSEIPAFLYFLINRKLSVPISLTRMWFSPEQIRTNALLRVMYNSAEDMKFTIIDTLHDLIQVIPNEVVNICPKDIMNLIGKDSNEVRSSIIYIFKRWGFKTANPAPYHTYNYIDGEYKHKKARGRYYSIPKDFIISKFDNLTQYQ